MGSPRGARLTQGDWVTQKGEGGWWSDDERGTEMGRRVGASFLGGGSVKWIREKLASWRVR